MTDFNKLAETPARVVKVDVPECRVRRAEIIDHETGKRYMDVQAIDLRLGANGAIEATFTMLGGKAKRAELVHDGGDLTFYAGMIDEAPFDAGTIGISNERIEELRKEIGRAEYFASASNSQGYITSEEIRILLNAALRPTTYPWDGLTGDGQRYEASLALGRHDIEGGASQFDVIVVVYAHGQNAEIAGKLGRRLLPVMQAFEKEIGS